ncbi:SIMPL domain-containing protein [Paludibacterium purpuratum]|uniref:Putative secreted protein n=1 Tax=Paludibacterium purpuratum TaxID=1144873 RepID=A0A4R7AZ94_9NEIS|nr:SIMPL domain-containing protein [Paludibacterium purpuratum]TDR73557.1 putative secreted protein [Paludibacterium purpuratum]
MKPMHALIGGTLLLAAALPATAEEAATQLELTASSQREVANDQLDATLYVQETQSQPATLADSLNRKSAAAMAVARGYSAVQATSGAYSSWPLYDKNNQIKGWQGRAEIHLRSRDFVQGAQLVAKLQQSMLLGNVDFSVSDQMRKTVEQQMLPEAISQLQATAKIAAGALGKTSVSVRELSIGNGGNGPRPLMAMMAKRGIASTESVAAPDWQAGTTMLQLQVSGKLDLK